MKVCSVEICLHAIIYCLARQGSQGCATPAKGLEDNLTIIDKTFISLTSNYHKEYHKFKCYLVRRLEVT